MNSLSIYALVRELSALLKGAEIRRISWIPYALSISFEGGGLDYLHVIYHQGIVDIVPSNQALSSGRLGRDVLVDAEGCRINSVDPIGLTRSLKIKLTATGDWGGKEQYAILINAIPHIQSARLISEETEKAFQSVRLSSGEAERRDHALPEKQFFLDGLSSPEAIAATLERVKESSKRDDIPEHSLRWHLARSLSSEIVNLVEGIDPPLATSLVEHSNLEPRLIAEKLMIIAGALKEEKWSWCIYNLPGSGGKGNTAVYPIRLPVDMKPEEEAGMMEVFARRFSVVVKPGLARELAHRVTKPMKAELKKLERLKDNLSKDLEEANRAKEYRHYGNLLATYRHLLRRGMESITVKDFSGEREVTILLDKRLGPDENIKRYFTRARKGESGAVIIRERRKRIEEKIEALGKLIKDTLDQENIEELVKMILERESRSRGLQQARSEGEQVRFRTFRLDERHTVYVGRNDRENDELTHRFAGPSDYWFHAQGVPGSHVILKGANPSTPKSLLERVASIAAYYSKARHSSTVPVVYTEKRYVRKPRKSEPGTAVVMRGKTLFVKPELPEESEGEKI